MAKKLAKKTAKKVVVRKAPAQAISVHTPMDLLTTAIDKNLDIEKLEKLMDLQDRWEAKQARKAYYLAMAEFQKEMPPIKKQKQGDRYKYATRGAICKIANPILSKHGLSVHFNTKHMDAEMLILCTVTHLDGHSETTDFAIPIDDGSRTREGNKPLMNAIQQYGSASEYGRRYAYVSHLNIILLGEDDDGAAAGGVQLLAAKEVKSMRKVLDEHSIDVPVFCRFLGVDSLDDITKDMKAKAQEFVTTWKAARA